MNKNKYISGREKKVEDNRSKELLFEEGCSERFALPPQLGSKWRRRRRWVSIANFSAKFVDAGTSSKKENEYASSYATSDQLLLMLLLVRIWGFRELKRFASSAAGRCSSEAEVEVEVGIEFVFGAHQQTQVVEWRVFDKSSTNNAELELKLKLELELKLKLKLKLKLHEFANYATRWPETSSNICIGACELLVGIWGNSSELRCLNLLPSLSTFLLLLMLPTRRQVKAVPCELQVVLSGCCYCCPNLRFLTAACKVKRRRSKVMMIDAEARRARKVAAQQQQHQQRHQRHQQQQHEPSRYPPSQLTWRCPAEMLTVELVEIARGFVNPLCFLAAQNTYTDLHEIYASRLADRLPLASTFRRGFSLEQFPFEHPVSSSRSSSFALAIHQQQQQQQQPQSISSLSRKGGVSSSMFLFLLLLLLLLLSTSTWPKASCLADLADELSNYEDETEQLPTFPSIPDSLNPKLATVRRWPFVGLVGFMFVGASGNILVCMAVWRERRLQTATNYFLLSLAVADLLVCTLVMPFGIINEFYGHWPFDWRICNLWVTCDVLTCSSSILHMCFISVSRYLGIRNPLHARQANLFVSRRTVLWRIAIAWFSSALIASPLTMMSVYERTTSECSITNKYFLIFGSMLAFFIPMFVMVASYIMTVRLLSRRAKLVRNNSLLLTNTTTNSSCQQHSNTIQQNQQPSASSPTNPITAISRRLNHKDTSSPLSLTHHDEKKNQAARLANGRIIGERANSIPEFFADSVPKYIDDPQEVVTDAKPLEQQEELRPSSETKNKDIEKKHEDEEKCPIVEIQILKDNNENKAQTQGYMSCQYHCQNQRRRYYHSYCCCKRRSRHRQRSIIQFCENDQEAPPNIQKLLQLYYSTKTKSVTSSSSPSSRNIGHGRRCCCCRRSSDEEKTKSLVGLEEEEVGAVGEISKANKRRLLERPQSALSPEALNWRPLGSNVSSDSSSLTCYSLDADWVGQHGRELKQSAPFEVSRMKSPMLLMMKKLRGNDDDHESPDTTTATNAATTTALLSTWPASVRLDDKLSCDYQAEEKEIVRLSSSNTNLDPPSPNNKQDTQESSKLSQTLLHSAIIQRLENSSCVTQLCTTRRRRRRQRENGDDGGGNDDYDDQDDERLSSAVSIVIEPEELKEKPKECASNRGNCTGIQGESSDSYGLKRESGYHQHGSDSMLRYLCATPHYSMSLNQHTRHERMLRKQHRINHAHSSAISCPEGLQNSEKPSPLKCSHHHKHSQHQHHCQHSRHHLRHCRQRSRQSQSHNCRQHHEQQKLRKPTHLPREEIAFADTDHAPSTLSVEGQGTRANDQVPRVESGGSARVSTVAASSSLLVAAALPVVGLNPGQPPEQKEKHTPDGLEECGSQINKREKSPRIREKSQSSSSSGNGLGQSSGVGIQLNFSLADTGNEPQMIRYLGPSMQVKSEQKATKVLGLVFSTFICCWAPFFVINFAQGFVDRHELSRWVSNEMMVTFLWLGYISSTINPMIYTVFNKNFRRAFRQLILCRPASNQFGGRYSREPDLNRVFRFTSQYAPSNRSPVTGTNGAAMFTSSLYRAPPSASLQARAQRSINRQPQQPLKEKGFSMDENSTLLIMDDNQSPSNIPSMDTSKTTNLRSENDMSALTTSKKPYDESDLSKRNIKVHQLSGQRLPREQHSCNTCKAVCGQKVVNYEADEASESQHYCQKQLHHHRQHRSHHHIHRHHNHHHHHRHHHHHHHHHRHRHHHNRLYEELHNHLQPRTQDPKQTVQTHSNSDKLAPVNTKLSFLDQNGNNQLIQDK